jgi:uncharacterized membrane protein YeiB
MFNEKTKLLMIVIVITVLIFLLLLSMGLLSGYNLGPEEILLKLFGN